MKLSFCPNKAWRYNWCEDWNHMCRMEIDVLSSMMRPILTYRTKSTYQVVCGSFLCTQICAQPSWWTFEYETLSCLSNKSSYFSWLTLYIEHAISKWYSSYIPYSVSLHVIFKHIMTIPTQLKSRIIGYIPSICQWDITTKTLALVLPCM